MIVVFKKESREYVGMASRVFDNGVLREPTLEELYPNADLSKLDFVHVEDSLEYALRPDAWQLKLDENNVPVGLERKPIPPRIHLTTDAPDTDGDGLPELFADAKSKATITAELREPNGNLIRRNFALTFKTTGGALSARNVKAVRGKATVELTSSAETIQVSVTASANGVEGSSLSFEFMPPQELHEMREAQKESKEANEGEP